MWISKLFHFPPTRSLVWNCIFLNFWLVPTIKLESLGHLLALRKNNILWLFSCFSCNTLRKPARHHSQVWRITGNKSYTDSHWRWPKQAYQGYQCRSNSDFLDSFRNDQESISLLCPLTLPHGTHQFYDWFGRQILNGGEQGEGINSEELNIS